MYFKILYPSFRFEPLQIHFPVDRICIKPVDILSRKGLW